MKNRKKILGLCILIAAMFALAAGGMLGQAQAAEAQKSAYLETGSQAGIKGFLPALIKIWQPKRR